MSFITFLLTLLSGSLFLNRREVYIKFLGITEMKKHISDTVQSVINNVSSQDDVDIAIIKDITASLRKMSNAWNAKVYNIDIGDSGILITKILPWFNIISVLLLLISAIILFCNGGDSSIVCLNRITYWLVVVSIVWCVIISLFNLGTITWYRRSLMKDYRKDMNSMIHFS